jgi:hypothetical protein
MKLVFFSALRLLAGTLFVTLAACKAGPEPTPGTDGGAAGYVTGRVTDPAGKPLAGARLYTDNAVLPNRGAEATSQSDGTYRIKLAPGLGQWQVRGYVLRQYNDRVYKLLLDPENADSFGDDDQAVRHFRWKLTGRLPDLSLEMHYGGTVELLRDPNATIYDNQNIEWTFKPVGPLIDGSAGKTLVLQAKKQYDSFLRDIPMGRYTISAVYKPTGQRLRVCDAWEGTAYGESVTLDFVGTESATRGNQMGVGYTD